MYRDYYTAPQEPGNLLCGYAGTVAHFSEDTLITGSIYASGIWKKGSSEQALIGEFTGHISIRKGIKYYNEGK